jgi:hypothetical protein
VTRMYVFLSGAVMLIMVYPQSEAFLISSGSE